MKIVLLIGLAGVIGTLSRYFMVRTVNAVFPDFPWGTLGVNIVGAFVAGFCFVLCKSRFSQFEEYFPVLFLGFLGFLGALTTFSTFALESARFLIDAQYGKFLLNILLQNVAGIGAAVGGIYLAKFFSNDKMNPQEFTFSHDIIESGMWITLLGPAGGRSTEPPPCRAHRPSAGASGSDRRILRSGRAEIRWCVCDRHRPGAAHLCL